MAKEFFPLRPDAKPTIYAYEDSHPKYSGYLKIGYTARDVAVRMKEHYPTLAPGKPPYTVVLEESAMRPDGTVFTDHEIHRYLEARGVKRIKSADDKASEWFDCSVKQVKAAVVAVCNRELNEEDRTQTFAMRPEQAAAVEKTTEYFQSIKKEKLGKSPHFLWNAKMRFGKTFAAYQLAKSMKWKKVLVLTFKPAVLGAWKEDLNSHVDFAGWQFISNDGLSFEDADKNKPFVCFGSFQDYLGKNPSTGGIKTKNEWVHATNWDCVIFDEYHYGAWRKSAKELFESDLEAEEEIEEFQKLQSEGLAPEDSAETLEKVMPITTDHYLYLSGTPFRAIESGEFIEEQIFAWTYSDEQRAKANWKSKDGANPYAALPRMVLLTYQMPDSIREIAMQGEFNEFDLNVFFSAKGKGEAATFNYEDEVQKWLDLLRGAFLETVTDSLKLGSKKAWMPFENTNLLQVLSHTFWFMPGVDSCHAMKNLLQKRQNKFYRDYEIIVAAGPEAGMGAKAVEPVHEAMGDPLKTKTITLSCGKLATGVTVRPWTGIFMLRNLTSPETYFQAAFRVQSPWTVKNPDSKSPNKEEIIKRECYVFDFAPNRALRQIADYSCRLNVNEANPEKNVADFISFLPILAHDGSSMTQIDAAGILDMAMSGTTATLLARRWESALLVNVDNATLKRLMDDKDAMAALEKIEGFRSLNQDIETIINKSDAVTKAKKEANDKELSDKKKKEISEAEKEFKSKRKQIQEKLIKFATRVPVFMYLTDYREYSLQDVIMQLEPQLFTRVTGLDVNEFDLLVKLGVFNKAVMNQAVYNFKRYEDASLSYTGISKHRGEKIGLYDTVVTQDEYDALLGIS
jgi:hypothetical protein